MTCSDCDAMLSYYAAFDLIDT